MPKDKWEKKEYQTTPDITIQNNYIDPVDGETKPLDERQTKFCPACQKDLPVTDFPKNRRKPDGLGSYCNPHNAEFAAASRKKRLDAKLKRETAADEQELEGTNGK